MAIYLIITSALLAAMQNLCMRRSLDTGGSTAFYVPTQLLVSCLIATLMGPLRVGDFGFNAPLLFIGIGAGLLLGIMMWALGESLKFGSASLTFAVLNSCSVMPAVLMALVFGAAFGHPYHWWNGLGSFIVIAGIFWGSWKSLSCTNRKRWVLFISLASIGFILFSMATQWKVLLEMRGSSHLLLPFKLSSSHGIWLTPIILLTAALFQLFLNLKKRESSSPLSKESLIYPLLGGISNGASLYLMILAAEKATDWQNAVLFPIFSIMIIQICNLWGRYLYNEKIDWAPQSLCLGGLILGSVYWSQLFN